MKKITLALFLALTGILTHAVPISGTFTIPGTTYATIAAAFADLNANGVDGPCMFLLNAGYTETTLNLTLAVPSASGAFPITFKMDPAQTGPNPKIVVSAGSAAATDGGIIIAGTDYVTFEKIDIDASAETTIEWGYALVKRQNVAPFDGCQHVTITNCNITLNKVNTKATGIYCGNHIATATTALAISATTDACNDCLFDYNAISNVYLGIALNGYNAPSPYALYDHNNKIGQTGGNTITNFGGANTACYALYATYQDELKVLKNLVDGGIGSTNRLAGILLQNGVSSSGEIAYNYISVTNNTTGSSNTYGIWNFGFGSTAATNKVSIHDNTFENCASTVSTASGPLYGILNSATPDTMRIFNNVFKGFSLSTTGSLSVIRSEASANNVFINNNTIFNNTTNGTGGLTLIHNQNSVNANIFSNTIYNCSANGGTVYGIYSSLGTNVTIYKNNLFNINSNNGSSASSIVYGINNVSTPNITIYNNFISDLKAGMATNNPAICGLYLPGGATSNVYNNTIFLNAASTGTTFGTAAVYAGTSNTTILRNNVLVNISTPGTTGYTVGYRRSSAAIGTHSATSDNNDFYVGTPGPNNFVFFDGTTSYATLASFQAYVAPAESASFTELPPFANVTTTPYDLHIQTGIATLCESGGTVVSVPAIVDDFDGNPRYPNTGYPENPIQPATAPDAGADEFAGGPNTPSLTFLVDMSTAAGFDPLTEVVYLAGDFPGAVWNEPGTNQNLQMTRIGSTLNYTLTMTLSVGSYEYKYFRNAGWGGGEYPYGPNRLVSLAVNTTVNDTWGGSITWANMQWPGNGNINIGSGFDVYAQAFIPNGITAAAGATYGLQAWVGYSTSNTNPDTWTNWVPAPFFGQSSNNDEFRANLGAVITSAGTYHYASRFQFGNGAFIYGGFSSGFWDGTTNVSGVLTVTVAPPLVFEVTGGGTYCQGETGMPVLLSSSEIGVDYQLYKNAIPYGTPVPGTGGTVLFGIQHAGTYTITGTNSGGTVNMNGTVVITETIPVPVSVTIAASVNPVATGNAVTLTATPVNGGGSPSYQWTVNGLNVGPNNAVFTYTPSNLDVVMCILTSDETCTTGNPASSNELTINVIDDVINLTNLTITNTENFCYNALQSINVAGSGTTFTVETGGSATMVAGQNILYYPGTTVLAGGYMHGYITTTGDYCPIAAPPLAPEQAQAILSKVSPASLFNVYPNPTNGIFTLEINGGQESQNATVEISGMRGDLVFGKILNGNGKYELSLTGKPLGLYIIRVVQGNRTETAKIIKQ